MGALPLLGMSERIRILEMLIEAFNRMKAELHTYGMSIPELMEQMREHQLFGAIRPRLEQEGAMAFSQIWLDCMERYHERLTAQEYRMVSELGDTLGRYALEEQLASLEAAIVFLTAGKNETKDRLRAVSKLYMGTSMSLAAMLVVLLL